MKHLEGCVPPIWVRTRCYCYGVHLQQWCDLMWQAEAERRKRAQILESEGDRQSKINVAEGNKADIILSSEAAQQDSINRAMGAPLTI